MVDPSGVGMAGVAVKVGGPTGALSLATDEQGWYSLGYARAGDYRAAAQAPRYRFSEVKRAKISPSDTILPEIRCDGVV